MIQIKNFVFNQFQENTYLVWDDSLECMVVDPGCYEASELNELTSFIEAKQLKPVVLANTHCHIDHILGNLAISDLYKLPLSLHQEELITYQDANKWAAMFGMKDIEQPKSLLFLEEGNSINFGNNSFKVLFTPGHSVASISFYHESTGILFSGDVLFKGSVGRTDLPGGNFNILKQSIHQKLFALPNETKVYSGHGPATTIGFEKANNPFVGLSVSSN